MIFKRTPSGLTNLHRFVGAEAVVFLEGGESIPLAMVEEEKHAKSSSDIRYWQKVFSHYCPGRVFEFRSVGSKEVVKSIALDIQKGSLNKVITVMDRDFDDLTGELIDNDNIIYTYGYSWENDCWTESTIVSATISLVGLCPTTHGIIQNTVDELFALFKKQIKIPVKVDSLLIQNGSSFFDRSKPDKYVSLNQDGKPFVCIEQIKKSFGSARDKIEGKIYRTNDLASDPIRDCFGHLLACFAYRVVAYFIKFYKMPKVAKEYATTSVIDAYIDKIRSNQLPHINNHYFTAMSRVTV